MRPRCGPSGTSASSWVSVADREPVVPLTGFAHVAGLEVVALDVDRVRGTLVVEPRLLDARDVLHRGVLSTAVETAASVGAAAWFDGRGHVVGVSNTTSTHRDVTGGRLEVLAEPVHRDEGRQQWTVDITDDEGLVASGTVHLVNIRRASTQPS